MAKPGEAIENPRTGEKVVFLQTTEQTGGELLELDLFVRPGCFSPPMHIHSLVEERVQLLSGQVKGRVGKDELNLRPGNAVVFPRGAAHTLSAEGTEMAHFRCQVLPAGEMEELFETIFGLYRDGRADKRGQPSLLQNVLLARKHHALLAWPPQALQTAALAFAAPLAHLLGYRDRYP